MQLKIRRSKPKLKKDKIITPVGFRYCSGKYGCQQLKQITEFRFRNNKPICTCKDCVSLYNKKYKQENTNYFKKYRENNLEKITAYNKEYYKKLDRDKIKLKNKLEYKSNPEKYLAYHKEWRKRNPGKYQQSKSKSNKKRKNNDSGFKLRSQLSSKISYILKKNNGSKNNYSILQKLPYSMEQLKQHLESQFEAWMTWENWGRYNPKTWNDQDLSTWTWQLDHIIPQKNFKYSSMDDIDFIRCWSLENLRPYSAKQNILDGAKGNR